MKYLSYIAIFLLGWFAYFLLGISGLLEQKSTLSEQTEVWTHDEQKTKEEMNQWENWYAQYTQEIQTHREQIIENFTSDAFCRTPPGLILSAQIDDRSNTIQPSCETTFSTTSLLQTENGEYFSLKWRTQIFPPEWCPQQVVFSSWENWKRIPSLTSTKMNIYTLGIRDISPIVVNSQYEVVEHPFSPHETETELKQAYETIQEYITSLPECTKSLRRGVFLWNIQR